MNATSGYFKELNAILKYPAIKDISKISNGSATENYAVPTNKEKVHNWGYLQRKTLLMADIDVANYINRIIRAIPKDN